MLRRHSDVVPSCSHLQCTASLSDGMINKDNESLAENGQHNLPEASVKKINGHGWALFI